MKLTIIGTNGLLANEIGELYAVKGYEIISYGLLPPLSHRYNQFHQINLLKEQLNYEQIAQSDIIIYASGAGIQSNLDEGYELIYPLNTYIPITICKELSKVNYKGTFITFGSYFEIGANYKDVKFTEIQITQASHFVPNDYCIAKRILSRFITSNNPTFNHLHLILPTIYGENESSHRLIPYTIESIKQKKEPQYTTGTQVRQYLYIKDVPKIISELINKKEKGIFNIAGTDTFSVVELVTIIFSIFNKVIIDSSFNKVNRDDITMENLQLDTSKLKKLMPYFEYTPITAALNNYF